MLHAALLLGVGLTILFAFLGWLLPADGLSVRLVSLVVDAFFAGVAFLLLRQLAEEPGEPDYAWLLVGGLGIGALLHALGVLDWDGDAGFVARGTGTVLVLAALVVPSTLTLAFPLASFLAVSALRSGRTADRPRPSPRRSRSCSPG
jgi:hypothetical protein